MTFIATMRESSDSILIAAESGQIDTEGLRTKCLDKLKRHPRLNIAWGASGSATAGYLNLADWLTEENPKTWDELRHSAEQRLAQLNGHQMALAKMVRNPNINIDAASVLVAGFIKGEMRILEIGDAGAGFYINEEIECYSIGAGHLPVPIACQAVKSITQSPLNVEQFHSVLESAAKMIHTCDPPIHIWRITKDNIKILT